MDIWSGWGWPLATALLGFVYVYLLVSQYAKRRKMHQLMWAIGFLLYAVAAVMEAWSESAGNWNQTVYRIYIVLAASLVGFLGNGTLYLITKKRAWGDLYLAFNVVCMVVFLYGTFTTRLDLTQLVAGVTVGGKALGGNLAFPRVMGLAFNIPGSLLLLGGSAWSVVRFWPNKAFRYRVRANILIIVGTLLIAGAGSLARFNLTAALYPAEMVASAILLWGFLLAWTSRGARRRSNRSTRSIAPPGNSAPAGVSAPHRTWYMLRVTRRSPWRRPGLRSRKGAPWGTSCPTSSTCRRRSGPVPRRRTRRRVLPLTSARPSRCAGSKWKCRRSTVRGHTRGRSSSITF